MGGALIDVEVVAAGLIAGAAVTGGRVSPQLLMRTSANAMETRRGAVTWKHANYESRAHRSLAARLESSSVPPNIPPAQSAGVPRIAGRAALTAGHAEQSITG